MAGKWTTEEFQVELDNVIFDIKVDVYYDSGRTYGPPEDCYPPELDFDDWEITRVTIGDQELVGEAREWVVDKLGESTIYHKSLSSYTV